MLKHISSLKGQAAKLSGLREAYFGTLLRGVNQTLTGMEKGGSRHGLDHIVRFVESFQVRFPVAQCVNSKAGKPVARCEACLPKPHLTPRALWSLLSFSLQACAWRMQDESGMWLVFHDEGTSVHSLMYAPAIAGPHHTPPHASHAGETFCLHCHTEDSPKCGCIFNPPLAALTRTA